ncbi:MAG: helix-turn-helix domain-containing protein [Rickettsiales bacterium]
MITAAKENLDYKTIGQMLKEARESLHLPAEQVCRDLKIRKNHLQAIEAGELSNLPGDVYTRGYVRMLADYLKVDLAKLESFAKALPDPQHRASGYRRQSSMRGITMVLVAIAAFAAVAYLAKDNQRQMPKTSEIRQMPGYLQAYLTPEYARQSLAYCFSFPQRITVRCMSAEEKSWLEKRPLPTILTLADPERTWYLNR